MRFNKTSFSECYHFFYQTRFALIRTLFIWFYRFYFFSWLQILVMMIIVVIIAYYYCYYYYYYCCCNWYFFIFNSYNFCCPSFYYSVFCLCINPIFLNLKHMVQPKILQKRRISLLLKTGKIFVLLRLFYAYMFQI